MKYIIDLPDNTHWVQWIMESTKDHHPYVGWKRVEDLIPYIELDKQTLKKATHEGWLIGKKEGVEEAWDFATSCIDMDGNDFYRCFEDDNIYYLTECTYSEAKTKYDEWKKKKDEIRVGDEVVYHGNKYIVGYVGADEVYHIVDRNWIKVVVQGNYQILKTGRHFDEVEELLKKMGGKAE